MDAKLITTMYMLYVVLYTGLGYIFYEYGWQALLITMFMNVIVYTIIRIKVERDIVDYKNTL